MRHLLALALLSCPGALRAAPPDSLAVCNDVHDPLTLDPHKEFSEKNHTLLQQIYEGLVRFGPDGNIEPALAASWERIGPLKMRFHLRDNIHFHNGEPFSAESVKFSIQRMLDPRTGYPGLGFLGPLDHVEVVDPLTIDLLTKFPDGVLLNRLAGSVLIIPPGYLKEVGEEEFSQHPVGTGAFQFDHWEKGKQLVLKANPDYWMKGYPKLRNLIFRFVPEDRKLPELFSGNLDLVTNIPGTQTLQVQKNPNTVVVKGKTFYTSFAGLKSSGPPFADIRVRKAVNMAIDAQELIRYDLLGNGSAIATLTMPGETGHDPGLKHYPYSLEQARALLREAGYPNGFSIESIVNINAERTAKIIVASLAKIGIRVKPTLVTDSELVSVFKDQKFKMAIGGVPDPMAHSYFIQSTILYSKSPFSLAKNPKYDSLLETMVSTIDDKKRESLAKELDRYIYDQALCIFTYQRLQTHAVRKGLKFTHYVTGMPYFFSAQYENSSQNSQAN